MDITDHMLEDVPFLASPNRSGRIKPRFLVMHYTAGFSASGAISWLRNPASRASAHLVIDNDGDITQLVPFNIKAWHAGPSRYKGTSGLNDHSIGFEITNVGWLRKQANGTFTDWTGRRTYREGEGDLKGRDLIAQPHPRVGGGMLYWPSYPEAQLAAVELATRAVLGAYDIEDIVSHEEIDTRGWKTDPGPAFPMQRFKRLLGNDRSDGDAPIPNVHEADRLTASLRSIREIIDAELDRAPPSVPHLRWRHAEVAAKAAEALKGD